MRDLGVRPDAAISSIAARSGSLYVAGQFTTIGARATQPTRGGLAQLDPATGDATTWNPPATPGRITGLAVTEDAVYTGGESKVTYESACATAFSRTTAQRTAWAPRLGDGDGCGGVGSVVASGVRPAGPPRTSPNGHRARER